MENIKKIDIHAHATAFPEYVPGRKWNGGRFCSGEQVIEFYDKLNIEKGVLLPIQSPECQLTVMSNENCKWIADQHPDRFMWFCNVDPRAFENSADADLAWVLNQYIKLGAKGVGEITSQVYADDPKLDNLFSCCEELDLPVLIHIGPQFGNCYGIVDELGLYRLEKMLKKHPKLKLLGHSQPFWSEISADNNEELRNEYPTGKVTEGRIAELMREYGNLYCDLSAGSGANAMMRDPEYAAKFMEEFSDRLLYGCDICAPSNTHPFPFDEFLDKMVDDGMLSIENYTKIVRDNALKILKEDK